ncbi:hypothetical protein [uncultured Desulfovibrio sp.]|uniref:hypothetical protein n=1 Tax=uncultured Desulfovibrio sp. TaxID=167968 RepID=UPI002630658F|nr:hypothetical protein [uncultured Desulfovibrio sp.]
MSTRGTMVQCFFLHAVHVAALCLLLFFHLIELRAWLTLWLIAVSLAASLTYALLAAAVGPHIPRRPALAHLVVAGTFLFSSLLAGILFAWQDWLGGYGHSPAMPLWRTFQAAGNGLVYGGIFALLFLPLSCCAYMMALSGTRRLAGHLFSLSAQRAERPVAPSSTGDTPASTQENSP